MGNLVAQLERNNQTETFNVIITPQMETAYKIILQTTGIFSALLSIFIIFLIIFRTPSKVSTRLQFDMIGLQICFLIFDVHICCLFIPKSTLPYFAGYCMGVLCGIASFHVQFIFAIGVILETLAMFFICLLQRFVTLTDHIGNSLVLSAITTTSIVLSAISPIYFFFIEPPKWKMIQYIEITPKMMWIVDKPGWMVYFIPSTYNILSRIASVLMFILVIFFSVGSIIIIKLISKYISNMSSASSKSHSIHTAAIRNLILQFIIFSLFLSIPTLIIVIPLLFALDSGTTFFLISESILCSHGLANSIVAIAFNSNFRRAITENFLWSSLGGVQNSRAGKRQSIIGINQRRPSISLY